MADFVAVIRRTVDGLSENTPEMRGKVYEKARSAVRRQLENMNPRPSDDMINRQLNKLEQAIGEVESEHAEALAAVEETEAVAPGVADTPIEHEPPASTEPESATRVAAEPEHAPSEEQVEEPAGEETGAEEPVSASAEAADEQPQAGPVDADAAQHEPIAAYDDGAPSEPAREIETDEPAEETAAAQGPSWTEEQPAAREYEAEQAPPVEPIEQPEAHADELRGEQAEPQPDHVEPVHSEPQPSEEDTTKSATSEWALPEWDDTTPTTAADAEVAPEDSSSPAPELLGIHPVEPERAESAQPAGEAEPSRSWSFDEGDPFAATTESKKDKSADADISEWSWPVEKAPVPASQEERASTAWDHIDDLLGFGENGGAGATNGTATATKESGSESPVAAPARPSSYRATPKPSRFNFKRLAIGAVIALLLGGGGYAYWQNREAGNAWLSGLIAKIMPEAPEAPEAPAGENAPADQSSAQPGAPETARTEDSSTKFTQRLLADGSEVDDGPAGANGTEVSQEGKSVAPQTEAGQAQGSVAATLPPAGEQAAATATGQNAGQAQNPGQASQAEISVADGEKMFLYEERLGQSSPTAIPGTVAWSIKDESPGGDAKPEPAIQAQITVPDRGLTALMTIKRNADPSLPASHVIEFVFSLPENFEGGAIDGVQRVSMKRTEQDRGDPLIAVPAKITDDFHMIALNDFAEAVGNNMELLRSRSWIDIPITYRNGRRALLTLEKGAAGVEAFNKAMQAWSTLGNTAASSQ
ncbi:MULTISPECIES: hypothetical protein [unclassified Sinorhizobium]|uniref:hypothetical protein n=1 Tax=unclassified Sinorhizobium TaxID=2613772 RepID=UPI0024C4647B|nr:MULTISPECIES: hypothetical protein [unclassified Sinorhizobium]MDK1375202.1 hypothetical protein [Sinorhizobium sp. 6-70]MDK1478008.1 hypothetical protein [Sinorhizobium sp. 6-117]